MHDWRDLSSEPGHGLFVDRYAGIAKFSQAISFSGVRGEPAHLVKVEIYEEEKTAVVDGMTFSFPDDGSLVIIFNEKFEILGQQDQNALQ